MLAASRRPSGDFRTTYRSDMTLFDTRGSALRVLALVILLALLPVIREPWVLWACVIAATLAVGWLAFGRGHARPWWLLMVLPILWLVLTLGQVPAGEGRWAPIVPERFQLPAQVELAAPRVLEADLVLPQRSVLNRGLPWADPLPAPEGLTLNDDGTIARNLILRAPLTLPAGATLPAGLRLRGEALAASPDLAEALVGYPGWARIYYQVIDAAKSVLWLVVSFGLIAWILTGLTQRRHWVGAGLVLVLGLPAVALISAGALFVLPQISITGLIGDLTMIGILAIAALGLNVLVGFTGQISLGQAAFFGLGAFTSAWLSVNPTLWGALPPLHPLLAIYVAGCVVTVVGMLFGIPAIRIKGLYLAIATLAAQFILQDFFNRADGFTGAPGTSRAETVSLFGFAFDSAQSYFYVVLVSVILCFVSVANMMRTRDGRALVAVRDHYLSAEIMGINLARYRVLSFGLAAFFAGIAGGLYAHYLRSVSAEFFTIQLSIQFLAMIIIGGLGSVQGTLMGVAFIHFLPFFMQWLIPGVANGVALIGSGVDTAAGATVCNGQVSDALAYLHCYFLEAIPPEPIIDLTGAEAYLKQIAVGAAIILFLIFEPDGLAHRWKLTKAYWKLYPFSY